MRGAGPLILDLRYLCLKQTMANWIKPELKRQKPCSEACLLGGLKGGPGDKYSCLFELEGAGNNGCIVSDLVYKRESVLLR